MRGPLGNVFRSGGWWRLGVLQMVYYFELYRTYLRPRGCFIVFSSQNVGFPVSEACSVKCSGAALAPASATYLKLTHTSNKLKEYPGVPDGAAIACWPVRKNRRISVQCQLVGHPVCFEENCASSEHPRWSETCFVTSGEKKSTYILGEKWLHVCLATTTIL